MKIQTMICGLLAGLLLTVSASAQPPARPQGQQAQGQQPQQRTAAAFVDRLRALDANQDGKITKDELPERMQSILTRVDTNKDNAIDEKELQALEDRFTQRAGAQRPQGNVQQGDRPQGQRPQGNAQQGNRPQGQRPPGFGGQGGRPGQGGQAGQPGGQRPQGFGGQGGRPGQGGQPGQAGGQRGLPPLPIFMVLDRDRNGEISKEEIANAAKALSQLDRDRNGKLTIEELMPSQFNRGGRPGQGGQPGQPGQGGDPAQSGDRPQRPQRPQ